MSHPFWRVFFLALLVLAVLPQYVAAQVDAVFSNPQAQADFPNGLTFSISVSGTVSRAEVAYTFTGEALTRVVSAEIAGDLLTASADAQLNYIPPGVTVSYYWTVVDDSSHSTSSESYTVAYADNGHDWQTLADTNLRLHWYDGDAAFGQTLLAAASAGLGRLLTQYGVTTTLPTEIWVYGDEAGMFGAMPPDVPEWVGGKAYPANGVILALIAPGATAKSEAGRILPHELSHLAVYQATLNPYNTPPSWLDEGLAIANQENDDPALQQALDLAATLGGLTPLTALGGQFPLDPNAALLAYAESASAVRYMNDRYGQSAVGKTLAAFRDGVTYDEALQAGIGLTVAEFDREWRAALAPATAVAPPPTVAPTPSPTAIPATPTAVVTPTPPQNVAKGIDFAALLLPAGVLIVVIIALSALIRRRVR